MITKDDLIGYFSKGEKDPGDVKIGTEHEKFVYAKNNLSLIPYDGDQSILKVFEKFIWDGNKYRDVILSVRSENHRARSFYEKYNFKVVSDIEWGTKQKIKGKVYLLEQKILGIKKWL